MPNRKYTKKSKKSKKAIDKTQDKRITRLENLVVPEYKYSFSTESYQRNTNALDAVELINPTRGTSFNERVGDQISVKKITFDCRVYQDSGYSGNWVRFIMVQQGTYAQALNIDKLLYNYDLTNKTDDNAWARIDPDVNSVQFHRDIKKNRILMDKTVFVGTYILGSNTADSSMKTYSWSKVFKKPLQVYYENSNLSTGALYLYILPGNSTTNTNNPQYSWMVNIDWFDM